MKEMGKEGRGVEKKGRKEKWSRAFWLPDFSSYANPEFATGI